MSNDPTAGIVSHTLAHTHATHIELELSLCKKKTCLGLTEFHTKSETSTTIGSKSPQNSDESLIRTQVNVPLI